MTLDVRHEGASVPLMADGTPLTDLIDFETRELKARVNVDPEVFDLELRNLFAKTWVFVAHESEVREPGDFVSRYIGRDPVIVSRGEDGNVHVLLNVCSHRGGQVCRADHGSASNFKCPYHGWTYETDGALQAVPGEREAFGSSLDKDRAGLARARVETFGGLIFANWDHDAPSFEEELGDFKFYFDMPFRLLDWEVVGSPQRWIVKCNWKFGADNFAGDGYHTAFIHRSMGEVWGMPEMLWAGNFSVNVTDAEHGHGARMLPGVVVSPEELDASPLDAAQREIVESGFFPIVGTVFPNLSFLVTGRAQSAFGDDPVGQVVSSVRTWMPRSADEMEVWSWVLVERGASEEHKRIAKISTLRGFGSSGVFEQDDAEAWSQIQRMTSGAMGRERSLRYQITSPHQVEGWLGDRTWPGPGEVHIGFTTEDNQWNWWRRWFRSLLT